MADAPRHEPRLHPPLAGVLSAYGMGLADRRVLRERTVEVPLEAGVTGELAGHLDGLEEDARAELRDQGVEEINISILRRVHLRYGGTDTALIVDLADRARMVADFEAAHKRRFGFLMEERGHVAEAVSVEAVCPTDAFEDEEIKPIPGVAGLKPLDTVFMVSGAGRSRPRL